MKCPSCGYDNKPDKKFFRKKKKSKGNESGSLSFFVTW